MIVTYETINVTLSAGTFIAQENIKLPAGKVIRMATVVGGDLENKIVNHSVTQNNNDIIKPSDLRFSAKTNGGDFVNSLRPVDFEGGRTFEAKLNTAVALAADITVQFLFLIVKEEI